ncbi:conserved domain protein (plasmid) [Bacillus anthracis str. A0488]|uniref:Conserved domain protein n=1 Tax=Bacillus anthracis TaxID=1392 RepID=Q6EZR7_BACAN|nr:hypothetical protein BX_A0100 [Bacillus anthracis str. A2012]AAT28841.2 conserved domain protein [Bacillus anthracis str. 'Ames Ancestor']EDR16422.1 conserved domain protein [Bacillus anthracis str. A0488]EDR85369.1 hypothetical protein BAQ_A0015 [Bacillus anthracis str. A0193]EDR90661.1 conserved domain protein [Bacillus anthracis str. A0442]EDS94527.1 conserved domain protein [Bacillus anthracis str. A0389]EDT17061.1 conserved domain protein [Bacillus anthracis str. A0465]EDT64928.1 con
MKKIEFLILSFSYIQLTKRRVEENMNTSMKKI